MSPNYAAYLDLKTYVNSKSDCIDFTYFTYRLREEMI